MPELENSSDVPEGPVAGAPSLVGPLAAGPLAAVEDVAGSKLVWSAGAGPSGSGESVPQAVLSPTAATASALFMITIGSHEGLAVSKVPFRLAVPHRRF